MIVTKDKDQKRMRITNAIVRTTLAAVYQLQLAINEPRLIRRFWMVHFLQFNFVKMIKLKRNALFVVLYVAVQ